MTHVESTISAIPRERRMRLAATLAGCTDPLLQALGMDISAVSAREDAEFAEMAEGFAAERHREIRKLETELPPPPAPVKENRFE
ncbi:hypothetical protein [Streptomyces sp. NPDC056682]|uniref:hypothetical protein n=1 Tax=Streptomyces sp. NPDC056682 TaxID=3345909 RepID=UPI00367CB03B